MTQPPRGADIEALLEEWWQDRVRAESDPKFGPYFRKTHERVLEEIGRGEDWDACPHCQVEYDRGYSDAKEKLEDALEEAMASVSRR